MALYQLKCEIKPCEICNEWIEYSKTLVIINHKHYHRRCILDLYLKRQMLNAFLS